MSRLKELSATGNVAGTDTVHLHSVVLAAGSDAATLIVKDGGSGGTTVLTLKAATATTTAWEAGDSDGAQLNTAHATFTGTGPVADFEYR